MTSNVNNRRIFPRSLRVLFEPARVFFEAAQNGRGIGTLLGLLALELVLVEPFTIARHGMRVTFDPLAALLGIWSTYMHYALPPLVGMLLLATAVYYGLRVRGTKLDIWNVAAALAYAWSPHVILVAASTLVAALGFTHTSLVSEPLMLEQAEGPAWLVSAFVELAPSAALAALAVFTLAKQEAPARRERGPGQYAVIGTAVTIIAAAFFVTAIDLGNDWRLARPLMPGDPVPSFSAHGSELAAVETGDLHGEVVLIDFWASWCPPCVAAMPELQQMHSELGDRGFRLVSINAGDESSETIARFARVHELDFPIYEDRGALQRLFGVQSLPTAFLIGPSSRIRDIYIGATSTTRIRQDVLKLLDEEGSEAATSIEAPP